MLILSRKKTYCNYQPNFTELSFLSLLRTLTNCIWKSFAYELHYLDSKTIWHHLKHNSCNPTQTPKSCTTQQSREFFRTDCMLSWRETALCEKRTAPPTADYDEMSGGSATVDCRPHSINARRRRDAWWTSLSDHAVGWNLSCQSPLATGCALRRFLEMSFQWLRRRCRLPSLYTALHPCLPEVIAADYII